MEISLRNMSKRMLLTCKKSQMWEYNYCQENMESRYALISRALGFVNRYSIGEFWRVEKR